MHSPFVQQRMKDDFCKIGNWVQQSVDRRNVWRSAVSDADCGGDGRMSEFNLVEGANRLVFKRREIERAIVSARERSRRDLWVVGLCERRVESREGRSWEGRANAARRSEVRGRFKFPAADRSLARGRDRIMKSGYCIWPTVQSPESRVQTTKGGF